MTSPRRPVVLLLHDQLLDARVWRGFADLISIHADILTVDAPAPAEFRRLPSEWAADMEAAVQPVLAAAIPIDLALGVGWALGTALSLVERGVARRALLVNPWPPEGVLHRPEPMPDITDFTDEERRLFAPRFDEPGPSETVRGQLEEGMVGEEAMNYMLEVAWETDRLDVLDEPDRLAVRQIHTEAFSRLLPMSLEPLRDTGSGDEPDWTIRAAELAPHCTVTFGRAKLLAPLRELLAERAPGLAVTELPTVTSFPWLEAPGRMAALVRELLDQ